MAIQNTKNFQDYIVNQEISDEKEKNIEQMIGAFSEYIVAINPEYAYNKTYLGAYVEDFIQCQKVILSISLYTFFSRMFELCYIL